MVSESLHSKGIYKNTIIPNDIGCALDILENYKKYELSIKKHPQKDFKSLKILAQKKIGIDKLEDYLIDRAFEAPISILIEDFAYKMNIWCAKSERGSEAEELYKNMRIAADDVLEYFL